MALIGFGSFLLLYGIYFGVMGYLDHVKPEAVIWIPFRILVPLGFVAIVIGFVARLRVVKPRGFRKVRLRRTG